MKLKTQQVEIDEADPFKNDELNLKDNAIALKNLVLSSEESLVICIDAPFGRGKTTFLKMWRQLLKNDGVPTIYYNAWASDFSDDALLSLIGEVGSALDEADPTVSNSSARNALKRVRAAGASLTTKAVPAAIKAVTAGLVDLEGITEEAFASLAETIAREQLERYQQSKKSIKKFKEHLHNFAHQLSKKDAPQPLVFIIDELDRCRPNFAVSILEKAKHFFNVDNIIFVLGADKAQLGTALKTIYGSDLDVEGYLRRFIDIDCILPEPEKGRYAKALMSKHGFNEYFFHKVHTLAADEGPTTTAMLEELFALYNLSLRDQERCCTTLAMAIRSTPSTELLHPALLCFLIVIKQKAPDLYRDFIRSTITPNQFLRMLSENPAGKEFLESDIGPLVEAYIIVCTPDWHMQGSRAESYRDIVNSNDACDQEIQRAHYITERINYLHSIRATGILPRLVRKIELASHYSS